jgi:hypothetical protein
MSISSPAEMTPGKQSRDLRNTRRRSLMNLFSTSSVVPLRRGSVQGAHKFGLVDMDTDTQDVEEIDIGTSKNFSQCGIAGSIPEDIIREIAALLSIADILSFSLAVSSVSSIMHHYSF